MLKGRRKHSLAFKARGALEAVNRDERRTGACP